MLYKKRKITGEEERIPRERSTNALIRADYSLEALMRTEFEEGLCIEKLAERIAVSLGERDTEFLSRY